MSLEKDNSSFRNEFVSLNDQKPLKLDKVVVLCRFYGENGECFFNSIRATDTVPSLASNPRDINSPRYTRHSCLANMNKNAILTSQQNCDQFEKGTVLSVTRQS